jgi:hypothetical protein
MDAQVSAFQARIHVHGVSLSDSKRMELLCNCYARGSAARSAPPLTEQARNPNVLSNDPVARAAQVR